MGNVIKKNQLPCEKGFTLEHKLSEKELEFFRNSISSQWIAKIFESNPFLGKKIKESSISIENYHLISNDLEHSKIWNKSSRILNEEFVNWFLKSDFANLLEKKFGKFIISDEDNLGFSNIYWRLVRPKQPEDIGPLHRDSWFWELNDNFPKPNNDFYRLKVWIPIYTEIGLNGLLVEPFSQFRENIKWNGEKRHGIKKPLLITPLSNLYPVLIKSEPGNAVIFNDNLIHGGALNNGSKCRVSVEFTMIFEDKK